MNCEQCGKLWAYTNSQRIELPLTHISIGNKKVVALIRPPFFGIDPNATAPACWTKNELKRKVTSLRKFFFRIRILNGGWTRGQCAFRRPVLLAYGYDVRNSKNEERSSMTFYCHNVSGQFLTGQFSWIKTLSTWITSFQCPFNKPGTQNSPNERKLHYSQYFISKNTIIMKRLLTESQPKP